MSAWLHDLRQALRALRRHPGFTAVATLTLGLGIGANTAVFSAVHGLLLRPLPFSDPDQLVLISTVRGGEGGPVAVPELDDLKALPVIADAAMYSDQPMYNASGFGAPEELQATLADHNLFRVLGVEPLVGSTFPAHFDRTRQFGVVISHGLWTRRFAQDPDIIGQTITLDGAPGYTIHGVLPPGFNFPSHSDLFRSSGISADPESYLARDRRSRMAVARLAEGVTVDQARAAVATLGRQLERDFPETNRGLSFGVVPLADTYTGAIRPFMLLLVAGVALVLLMACVNVANLLLSRAVARDREIAIRMALGAGRWPVVRQLLVESLVLSALGGVAGLVIALLSVATLTAMVPVRLPEWMAITIDLRVGLFLAAVALLAGLVTGLVPAIRTGSGRLAGVLNDSARGSSAGAHHRLRSTLVVGQVALALVLLIGAGLLATSVARLQQVSLGFSPERLLTFRVQLAWAVYGSERTLTFHERVLERLAALPGVREVTFEENLPMSSKPRDPLVVRARGESAEDERRAPYVNLHRVGPAYFQTMRTPIRQGRGFSDDDRPDTALVAVVSQRLAARVWPDQDPLGQQIQVEDPDEEAVWRTVVGVSGPVLHHHLDADPGLDVYVPFTQSMARGPYYVLRTAADPLAVARAATAIIGEVDAQQSFFDVQTMEQRVTSRMWQRRLAGTLFGAFSLLAVILAMVGLYGVLSALVAQQTREIGVRVALGAEQGRILRMVLGRGLILAAAGVALGLAAAVSLGGWIASLLYEVSPTDPWTLGLACVVVLAVAATGCYLPARRAARVDPIVALRAD